MEPTRFDSVTDRKGGRRSGEQIQPGGPFQRRVDHRQSCRAQGHRETHDGEPDEAPRHRRPGHRVVRPRALRLLLPAAAAEDGVRPLLSGRQVKVLEGRRRRAVKKPALKI